MEMTCPDCGMCQTHGNLNEIKKGQKDSNGYTKCWSGYHAAGTKKSATTGKQVRNCVPNESVELDEISRRDFLRGAGATAGLAAMGGAKADRAWQQDELTKQWKGQMTSETFDGAVIHWNEEEKIASVALTRPTNFSPNNVKQNRLYFPKITSNNFTIKIGNSNPISGTGSLYTFPLRQLGDYKGNGLVMFQGQKFTTIRDDFVNADKVLVRLEIDGMPTTMTFHDNPGHIQQRQTQKKQPILDKIYQEEQAGSRIPGFHGIGSAAQLKAIIEPYKDQIPDRYNALDKELITLLSNAQGHPLGQQLTKDIESWDRFVKLRPPNLETANDWLQSVYPAAMSRLKKYNNSLSQTNESIEQGVAKDLSEEFDLIESNIDILAERNGVDAEAIWEDLESLTDDELYVFAATMPIMEDWQKANKKDRTAGMSQKAVNAYRRENPGSKLKTAVTTKPSKLKKGSKASKRRKSYCSRSRGQMKMHNISCAKTPDKAICKARRRWNCE
jgi:hypothetical protein